MMGEIERDPNHPRDAATALVDNIVLESFRFGF
jgi:hypothetical protein